MSTLKSMTLIEYAIVLLITGILLAIAIPNYQHVQHEQHVAQVRAAAKAEDAFNCKIVGDPCTSTQHAHDEAEFETAELEIDAAEQARR